jgi:two-component system response regulator RpfG
LIVDDQPSARTMLRHVVEGIGPDLRVEEFGDPLAALRWSEDASPDLLLLDYRMPEMDGLEFTRRFRRTPLHRDVPIVLVTVVGDEPIRQAALDAGVIDFLVKPIKPRELRARCRNLLQLRQQGESMKQRLYALERQLLAGMREAEWRERDTLNLLARAAEYREYGHAGHLVRVERIAGLLAEALGLPDEEVRMIEAAAPLHDIGKFGIPDSILLKKGELTRDEWDVMKRHTLIGYDILQENSSRFVELASVIALRHHENFDGSGYPDGYEGEQIPLAARITAVADAFDAMLTDRCYHPKVPVEEAIAAIKAGRGRQFDPRVVDAFMENLEQVREIALLRGPKIGGALAPH